MAVIRNLDGFTDLPASDPLAALPFLDPTRWAVWLEDFLQYDKTQGNVAYTLTQTNGVDTIVGPTGVLTLTLAGADNDLAQLYLTDAPFQTTSGKKLIWECRCRVQMGAGGTIGQQEVFVGLSSVQTGADFVAADGLTRAMDDAMAFYSIDGTANTSCIQGENDTYSTEANAFAYANNTWMVLTCYYDGTSTFFYRDGALEATLTTNPPTSVVTPMMFVKAGEAFAAVLEVDYFLVAVER